MNNGPFPKVTVAFSREELDDFAADLSYLQPNSGKYKGCAPAKIAEYEAQDAARLKAYYAGDWHTIGIRAKALIRVDSMPNHTIFHELHSSGLWGIESDSESDYLNEVYKEQCAELRADIEAMEQATVGADT